MTCYTCQKGRVVVCSRCGNKACLDHASKVDFATNGVMWLCGSCLTSLVREAGFEVRIPQEDHYEREWLSFDWDRPNPEVARDLGLSTSRVSELRQTTNHPRKSGHAEARFKPPVDWESVDWSRPNKEIADEVDRTAQYISQIRRKLGKPGTGRGRSRGYKHKSRAERLERLRKTDTSDMTFDEIVDFLGVSKRTARLDLSELGRTVANGGYRSKNVGKKRPYRRKYDWDSVDWANKGSSEIARELGAHRALVSQTRKRLGKPKGPDRRWKKNWKKED